MYHAVVIEIRMAVEKDEKKKCASVSHANIGSKRNETEIKIEAFSLGEMRNTASCFSIIKCILVGFGHILHTTRSDIIN